MSDERGVNFTTYPRLNICPTGRPPDRQGRGKSRQISLLIPVIIPR